MIDARAVIHPDAKLAKNVSVGPWSYIGAHVEIGEGTWIGPHVVISGPTRIGKGNKVYQFTSIGEPPQAKSYAGEPTELEIGDENVIREFCTINRGTVQGRGITKIGDRNLLMAYVHVAHDCIVGNEIIFANNAALSGHVSVEDYAGFGGYSAVHQHCRIGAHCYVAGATSVVKDVPPYVLVSGHPATVYGLNLVGLRRRGITENTLGVLRKAYNIIYRQGLTVPQALSSLAQLAEECFEVKPLIEALTQSTRGIVR